jgi:TonB family protein
MRTLFATLALLLVTAPPLSAQDPLTTARDLYASARYDEALATLDTLRIGEGMAVRPSEVRALEQYRSLCLLALGRASEAEEAIGNVVAVDPFYHPAEAEAAPRVRAAFHDVRRRMLPEIAAERYATAKSTFDRKEYAAAADQFTQVVTLLEDPDMQGRLADLRTLAQGFLELAAASVPVPVPAPEPEPEAAPEHEPVVAAPPVPVAPAIYTADEASIVQPVSIRQILPRVPSHIVMLARNSGILEVIIDEKGRVEAAAVRASVHPIYDSMLLAAASDWRYQPARLNGGPVKFRKRIQVTVAKRE